MLGKTHLKMYSIGLRVESAAGFLTRRQILSFTNWLPNINSTNALIIVKGSVSTE